jgi:hypothetical protein
MSAPTAIQAVTDKLLQRLAEADPQPTSKPLDKAGNSPLNLFLYQIALSSAWRNQDLPTSKSSGQPARLLLPLILHYLVSACEEDQKKAHEKLGKAMLSFHDTPHLSGFTANSGIKNQADPIRVTVQVLNIDEMSKLWSSFQTAYRPSVAYEVGVVLIESDSASPAPLPVLRRGDENSGWDSSAQFPPTLNTVRFRTAYQPGVRLGETLTLMGQNLKPAGDIRVVFRHPRLEMPRIVEPDRIDSQEIRVTIPDSANQWPAGVYLTCVQNTVGPAGNKRTYSSNIVPIALLPEVVVPDIGLRAVHLLNQRSLIVPCRPHLQPGQSVQVLIGSVEIETVEVGNPAKPVAKWLRPDVNFPAQEHPLARLRIDGVDSLLHDPNHPEQGFDPKFTVQNLP